MEYDAFRESERSGWNERAALYDGATAVATVQAVPMLLHMTHLSLGARLLDVGCGPGYLAGAAQALGARATGVDFAPAMVSLARARFPTLEVIEGEAEALPFDDASFDVVASNIVLFHVAQPARAIAEGVRVLKPGGRFAFSQWLGPDRSDLYRELRAVLNAHADMSRTEPAPDAYSLSDPEAARAMMRDAGLEDIETRVVQVLLRAPEGDFFDFFMSFGVRVPLVVQAQDDATRQTIREAMNARMERFRTSQGYEVPMPAILYAGRKP